MGTYNIEENEGDTPEVRMEGYFSMDDLMNILDEMKQLYYHDSDLPKPSNPDVND